MNDADILFLIFESSIFKILAMLGLKIHSREEEKIALLILMDDKYYQRPHIEVILYLLVVD